MPAQQRTVAFPLDILGHFRVSVRWLAASSVLGVASWWLDVRASRLPFDRGALLVAVLTGICFGAALAMALIVSGRAYWCYRAARVGRGRRYALSIDRDGVSLHLLGYDLSWAEIGWARIDGRPTGRRGHLLLGAADTGPLSVTLRLRIVLISRLAFGTRGAAIKAWSAYGTPFAVDLRAMAAERGAVEDAVRLFAPGHCGAGRPETARQPFTGHSGVGWLHLLLAGAMVIGLGGWAQVQPFHDAWLLQHGLPATATVVKVITPCGARREAAEWEVSYTGRFGEAEFASTDLWACPAVGQTAPIMFDPANPAYVGDVRVLRNRPSKLLAGALLVTFVLLVLNWAVGFWREPTSKK